MGKKLKVRAEIMELLEENAGINLQDFRFDNGLFIFKKSIYLNNQKTPSSLIFFYPTPTPTSSTNQLSILMSLAVFC